MTIEYPLCLLAFACSSQNPPPLPPFPRRCMFQPTQSSRQLELLLAVLTNLMCRRRFARGASFRAEPPRVRRFPFEIPRPAVRVALDCAP